MLPIQPKPQDRTHLSPLTSSGAAYNSPKSRLAVVPVGRASEKRTFFTGGDTGAAATAAGADTVPGRPPADASHCIPTLQLSCRFGCCCQGEHWGSSPSCLASFKETPGLEVLPPDAVTSRCSSCCLQGLLLPWGLLSLPLGLPLPSLGEEGGLLQVPRLDSLSSPVRPPLLLRAAMEELLLRCRSRDSPSALLRLPAVTSDCRPCAYGDWGPFCIEPLLDRPSLLKKCGPPCALLSRLAEQLGAQLSVAILLPSSAMQSIAVSASNALLLPCCFDSITLGAKPFPMPGPRSNASAPPCCCCCRARRVVAVHLQPADAAIWLLPLLVMLIVPAGMLASQPELLL